MKATVIKVLLVDDDEDDYVMTRDLLAETKETKFDLQWVSTYDEAVSIIELKQHDVYLMDYRLGERTGLELLGEAIYKGCKAPIILLTGQGDHELDMLAMKSGASDYLVKGHINAPLLERSIRYAIERKRTEEHIYHMAYYDSLTKLPNRLLFQDRLKQALSLAARYDRKTAVLFLDLDNFKRVNDTFGHCLGDQLLVSIADRLKKSMRRSDSVTRPGTDNSVDTIARLGGDEFTIILTEIRNIEDAARVAQRILDVMSEQFTLNSYEIFISASIGIAVYPHDGMDIDNLLKNADAAMYSAKTAGKNSYQYYKQSMNSSALERLTTENSLRKALDRNEFLLHYQPQIDLSSGRIVGFEALIRWNHPDKKIVLPAEFIPIAEENGLILPIGEWVLQAACSQLKEWQNSLVAGIPVSVNLSSHQFQQKNFLSTVHTTLLRTGVSPKHIIFEITESTIMQNTDTVLSTLHELSALGVRFSIDDFGTGYSSLSYLKRFPLFAIKIDRSFVKEINTNPDDAAISKAIISMAHSLKLRVIAEGVETEQQLAFLREQGCDEIQGFMFSHPLPAEKILSLLLRENNGNGITLSALQKTTEYVQKSLAT